MQTPINLVQRKHRGITVEKVNYNQMKSKYLDVFGFSASLVCAIHCALMPFLLTLAQLGAIGFLVNPAFELIFILVSIAIALISIIPSYIRHHHRLSPLVVMFLGLLLVVGGKILFEEGQIIELIVTVCGASMIAIGHLINWRLISKHNR